MVKSVCNLNMFSENKNAENSLTFVFKSLKIQITFKTGKSKVLNFFQFDNSEYTF